MKLYTDTSTVVNTCLGSIFSVVVISPNEIISTFLIGMIGAIGAYCGSILIKFLVKKAKDLFRTNEDL